jgi:hypothetical protein
MKTSHTVALSVSVPLLLLGLVLPPGEAVGQQAGPTFHRYLVRNAAGFARVTIRPLLTAEEMDKAVEKWPPIRVPQHQ